MTNPDADLPRDPAIQREVRIQLVEHAQALLWRMLVGGVVLGVMFAFAGAVRMGPVGLFLGAALGAALGALGGALVTLVRASASHDAAGASTGTIATGRARDEGASGGRHLEERPDAL
ncbi:hypothetical protein Pla163_01890 [Planctomycetes bacterium Pla163]|uniref:Uncharacterized protein n=1 Tax=Rohdeia mirabilis TaxID=2528008 RepID=A0A518CV41_9BACT|nr:hypothetical protein Pla163_01890 [Planctomycetes bacterium Pla163]